VTESLPEQLARTRRFSVGAPHDITATLFLRSGALWSVDPERKILDGVNEYATDGDTIACVIDGELHTVDRGRIATPTPISRPRPRGAHIAYRHDGDLHVTGIGLVATEVDDYWWSPTGTHLIVSRSDVSQVDTWRLTEDPARTYPYAAVGRRNAVISLAIADLTGTETAVEFGMEYLVMAGWDAHGPYAVGLTRDQRTQRWLAIDPKTGASSVTQEWQDRCWVPEVPGLPARTESGALVAHLDRDGTRHLAIDGVPVTPPGLQLREVQRIDGDRIVFTASPQPTETRRYSYETETSETGPSEIGPSETELSEIGTSEAGVPEIGTSEIGTSEMGIFEIGGPGIGSDAEEPVLRVNRTRLVLGPRELRADLYLPSWHRPGTKLPVLLDPYGGPSRQRVTDEGDWRDLVSQWFAEHGFAVLVIDGAGTPGRGPDWEREIHGDQFGPVLDDQIAGLHAAARERPELDLDRVGIRSWSFGGAIAELALLRRPDVFHVAVAGAAPTDPRRYRARFRERYMGQLDENAERYDAYRLIDDAPSLRRPLLLMHGLADDNVHPSHTLRMSAALRAAGRPHEVVLLPGIGHSAIGSSATVEVLRTQLDFLRRHLGTVAG
jgi:dipeptidyl-peptidase-4